MQLKTILCSVLFLLFNAASVHAQYAKTDTTFRRVFVGSTFFVLANLIPDDNSPDFAQLNVGYRIGENDALSLEVKTWKYAWALGIPYGPSFEAPEERFPGYIRELGFALVYQHFWWKGLYTGVHVMSSWQRFVNDEGKRIDTGFQIFNTYRLGYHFKLANDRWFIEPSVAVTHRPYQSQMPDGFHELNEKWPNYFLGEPGLHFGLNF